MYSFFVNFILSILFLSLLSCGKNKTHTSLDTIEKYNFHIEKGYLDNQKWVESPLFIAIELSGAGTVSSSVDIKMRKINSGETVSEVIITIKEKGVLDDSHSETDCYFHLKKIDTMWRVVE